VSLNLWNGLMSIHGQTRPQPDERGYAIIEDLDGVAVGLMSPVSPDERYPPPEV